MKRLVLDADIVISGLVFPSGSPGRLVFGAQERAFLAITCPFLVAEVARGLRKPYLRARAPLAHAALRAFAEVALELSDPVSPAPLLRDADDDYLVALARAGRADGIVSGDRDLLDHAGLSPRAIDARTACERFGL